MHKAVHCLQGISFPARLCGVAVAAVLAAAGLANAQTPPPKSPPPRPAALAPDPLAPLTERERVRCLEVAKYRFRDVLGSDRFAVLNMVPVYRVAAGALPRTCYVELFDYAKNLDLQATIELTTGVVVSSRQLADVQPAASEAEVAEARRMGEQGLAAASAKGPQAAARSRLREILQLRDLQVNGMVRGDDQQCRRHRCIEVNYFQRGPDAGTIGAAEPAGAKVTWQRVRQLARVVVDLTSGAAVSTEVFQ
jgi:hypothetical protein